jgi:hypothetical protein
MLCITLLDNPLSERETKSRAEQLLGHLETMLSSEQIKEARTTAQEKTFDWIVKQVLKTV